MRELLAFSAPEPARAARSSITPRCLSHARLRRERQMPRGGRGQPARRVLRAGSRPGPAGSSAGHWMAPAAHAAVLIHSLRGDYDSVGEWRDRAARLAAGQSDKRTDFFTALADAWVAWHLVSTIRPPAPSPRWASANDPGMTPPGTGTTTPMPGRSPPRPPLLPPFAAPTSFSLLPRQRGGRTSGPPRASRERTVGCIRTARLCGRSPATSSNWEFWRRRRQRRRRNRQ